MQFPTVTQPPAGSSSSKAQPAAVASGQTPPVTQSTPRQTPRPRPRRRGPRVDAERAPPPGGTGACPVRVHPGRLFVNASPWGEVLRRRPVDGQHAEANSSSRRARIGVRVVRDGYDPFERTITVAGGETVRITDIVLVEIAVMLRRLSSLRRC